MRNVKQRRVWEDQSGYSGKLPSSPATHRPLTWRSLACSASTLLNHTSTSFFAALSTPKISLNLSVASAICSANARRVFEADRDDALCEREGCEW